MNKLWPIIFRKKTITYSTIVVILVVSILVGCRTTYTPKNDSLDAPLKRNKTTSLIEGESSEIEYLSWIGTKRIATLTPELKWRIREYDNNEIEINYFLNDTLKLLSSTGEKLKITNEITGYGIFFYFFNPPDYKQWKTSGYVISFLSWNNKQWEATLKKRDPYAFRINAPDYPFVFKKLK